MQVGKTVSVNLKTALQLLVVLHPDSGVVIFLPPVPLPLSGGKKETVLLSGTISPPMPDHHLAFGWARNPNLAKHSNTHLLTHALYISWPRDRYVV